MRRLVLLVELLDGLNLLLELHASVLKPNFDLALCQAQGVGHFDPPPPRQVVICVKLFLELQRLVARVRLTASTPQSVGTLNMDQTQDTIRFMFCFFTVQLKKHFKSKWNKQQEVTLKRSRPRRSFPTTRERETYVTRTTRN